MKKNIYFLSFLLNLKISMFSWKNKKMFFFFRLKKKELPPQLACIWDPVQLYSKLSKRLLAWIIIILLQRSSRRWMSTFNQNLLEKSNVHIFIILWKCLSFHFHFFYFFLFKTYNTDPTIWKHFLISCMIIKNGKIYIRVLVYFSFLHGWGKKYIYYLYLDG